MTPGTAAIRFYAELNDFLPPERRQRDVRLEFAVAPSVKDAIEGLGVPHTEVDLILVNGASVDFRHRLADGDRVSVFPVFERFDIADLTRLRPEPLREVRFVVDGHLGPLARFLRLLGFDTRWDAAAADDELAAVSVAERRVLLTRDRGLLKRGAVTHGLYVRNEDPDRQVLDVVRRLHLARDLRPFTRCMACNGRLEEVERDRVADRLEPGTRTAFDRFQLCAGCGRVYWKGAHHERLRRIVEAARAEAGR